MKKILYLGTNPPASPPQGIVVHYPVLRLAPRLIPDHILDDLPEFTHVIFTSKNSVAIFFDQVKELKNKIVVAIGQATADTLSRYHTPPNLICEEERQEGIIQLLRPLDLDDAYILFPRSSLARHLLENFFQERGIRHQVVDLYDTLSQKPGPVPNLEEFDEIVFTSPSTVHAFLEIFSELPKGKRLTPLGPITAEALQKCR
jgi:uroporphyrinogen-III synthase